MKYEWRKVTQLQGSVNCLVSEKSNSFKKRKKNVLRTMINFSTAQCLGRWIKMWAVEWNVWAIDDACKGDVRKVAWSYLFFHLFWGVPLFFSVFLFFIKVLVFIKIALSWCFFFLGGGGSIRRDELADPASMAWNKSIFIAVQIIPS